MIYNKQTVVKPIGLKTCRFDIDGDTYVNVREMAATDILYYQQKYKDDASTYDFACDMLAHSVVDDQGEPIFTDGPDVAANFHVGTSTLYAIQAKVFELSKTPITGEDPKK